MHTTESRARAYVKVKARRAEWLSENGPCKCGSWLDLQVDHVNPATKVSHRIWSWSEKRRLEELSKCQVLCRECHEAKTGAENSKDTHGISAYSNKGCRCETCKAAKRLENSRRTSGM